jgi:CRISPR-associated protein Cas5d
MANGNDGIKNGPRFRVRMRGDFACFSRPEFSTERLSYEVITPSAARGILEAILWKPAIRWEVLRISVLSPVRWVEFRRNEVNGRVPTQAAVNAANGGSVPRNFYADEDRAQRNTVALRDIDYVIQARLLMTSAAGPQDNLIKFREIFERRLAKGQHAYQPYFGCREFPATVTTASDEVMPISESRDLGWMLHDIAYGREREPRFFHARIENGSVEVPSWNQAVRT